MLDEFLAEGVIQSIIEIVGKFGEQLFAQAGRIFEPLSLRASLLCESSLFPAATKSPVTSVTLLCVPDHSANTRIPIYVYTDMQALTVIPGQEL